MAVLMGSVPLGLPFQDLVGGPMPRTSAPERTSGDTATSCDRLMRIHLPDGVAQELTLTRRSEFLCSYHFDHAREGVEKKSDPRADHSRLAHLAGL
jgi:hypothetical protein